jgi:hypothetical protein
VATTQEFLDAAATDVSEPLSALDHTNTNQDRVLSPTLAMVARRRNYQGPDLRLNRSCDVGLTVNGNPVFDDFFFLKKIPRLWAGNHA